MQTDEVKKSFWLDVYFDLLNEHESNSVGLINRENGDYYYLVNGDWDHKGKLPGQWKQLVVRWIPSNK